METIKDMKTLVNFTEAKKAHDINISSLKAEIKALQERISELEQSQDYETASKEIIKLEQEIKLLEKRLELVKSNGERDFKALAESVLIEWEQGKNEALEKANAKYEDAHRAREEGERLYIQYMAEREAIKIDFIENISRELLKTNFKNYLDESPTLKAFTRSLEHYII